MKVFHSRKHVHVFIFKFGLAALICCLPLSYYLMSIAQFLLALNWLVEGDYKRKLDLLRKNPAIFLFASLFLVYCTGFVHSENSMHALDRIKNALPVLLLPLVIGTSEKLSDKYIKTLFVLFGIAILCAAVINLVFYLRQLHTDIADPERMAVFMSPIIFSLLINMAIFIFVFLCVSKYHTYERILYASLALLLSVYLFLLGSLTGILIFILLVLFSTTFVMIRARHHIAKIILMALFVLALAVLSFGIIKCYNNNFHTEPVQIDKLEIHTTNGNLYSHSYQVPTLENGNVVGIYICEHELRKEWNLVSSIPYDSMDRKNQQISHTIIRYMTSKGLRKDSAGVQKLTPEDIVSIENGNTNYRFNESTRLFKRLYETLWEVDIYRKTGYVQNHSFAQRLAFYKTAMGAVKKNIVFGVGTGDVRQTMMEYARKNNMLFQTVWEGQPHNQFVFFLLAFGIAGFAWIMFTWIFPIIIKKKYRDYLSSVFFIISFVSMLSVDMLEAYEGIVFFTIFYSLLILRIPAS